MKKLLIVPAILLSLCLLAACGGQDAPPATDETTAESAIVTEAKITTEEPPETTQQTSDGLLDFALINRLFSMTLADYFREEGQEKQPEDTFEGGPYYSFSKYDPTSYFFFGDPDSDSPSSIVLEAVDLLVGRQTLTLGELKQWLEASEIEYYLGAQFEDDSVCCIFNAQGYAITAFPENDSTSDSAAVRRFFIKPMD